MINAVGMSTACGQPRNLKFGRYARPQELAEMKALVNNMFPQLEVDPDYAFVQKEFRPLWGHRIPLISALMMWAGRLLDGARAGWKAAISGTREIKLTRLVKNLSDPKQYIDQVKTNMKKAVNRYPNLFYAIAQVPETNDVLSVLHLPLDETNQQSSTPPTASTEDSPSEDNPSSEGPPSQA